MMVRRMGVRVTPRASRSQVRLLPNGVLGVWVTAPPSDGAANHAVVKLLAEHLQVPQRAITIVRGATSRTKLVEIREAAT